MGDSILSQLGSEPSIVLVRLRSLGDTVLATPAFAMLRRSLPDARIHVAMDERFADVLSGQPDIDGVLRIKPGAGWGEKARLLREIRGRRPSLCVDMHGGSTAAWMTALSGGRDSLTSANPGRTTFASPVPKQCSVAQATQRCTPPSTMRRQSST